MMFCGGGHRLTCLLLDHGGFWCEDSSSPVEVGKHIYTSERYCKIPDLLSIIYIF